MLRHRQPAFPVAAFQAWNSLLLVTRAVNSLLQFRRETKAHLFCSDYRSKTEQKQLLRFTICRQNLSTSGRSSHIFI